MGGPDGLTSELRMTSARWRGFLGGRECRLTYVDLGDSGAVVLTLGIGIVIVDGMEKEYEKKVSIKVNRHEIKSNLKSCS